MVDDSLRDRVPAWLAGSAGDRARFADMHRRFSGAPVYGVLVGGTNAVAAVEYDLRLLLLVVLASATMAFGTTAKSRARFPEIPAAITFALLQLNQVTAVMFTGGAESPLLPLTLVPLFTQAVCFRPAISVVALSGSGAAVVAAGLVAMALPPAPPSPPYLHVLVYLSVLGSLGLAAHHLADSDSRARGTATLDALTGLYNRRALGSHFADARRRAAAGEASVGLIMLDIDHFKAVNDTYGHKRGDQVLQHVAYRLAEAARADDLLYRIGGEEFVVLAPGTDAESCARVAERLRLAVSGAPVSTLAVTISAGVCCALAATADLESMTRRADEALYAAKRDGRNRVALAPADTRAQA